MRFPLIAIDPPWEFSKYSNVHYTDDYREVPYSVMTHERLCELPIRSVMEDDCAVALWTSGPFFKQAHEVAEAWGLRYVTCLFTWAKLTKKSVGRMIIPTDNSYWHMGMGYYTRANCEQVFLLTSGHPKREARDVRHLIIAPVTKHSEKPEEMQDRLERLFPLYEKKLELFARRHRPGWLCLGNELSGRDIVEDLEIVSRLREAEYPVIPIEEL